MPTGANLLIMDFELGKYKGILMGHAIALEIKVGSCYIYTEYPKENPCIDNLLISELKSNDRNI